VTATWWTKPASADTAGVVPDRVLARRPGAEFLPQLFYCSLDFSCSYSPAEPPGLTTVCLSGRICWDCRGPCFSLLPSDTNTRMCGQSPVLGVWLKARDTLCGWSASSSPTSCSSAPPARGRSSPCSRTDGCPRRPGRWLFHRRALRAPFIDGSRGGSTTFNVVAGCACVRGRHEAGCPSLSRCFVSQMCRAHDTSVMLVVRRMAPGTGPLRLETWEPRLACPRAGACHFHPNAAVMERPHADQRESCHACWRNCPNPCHV